MTGGNASALLPGHPVLGRLAQQSTETWLSLGNLSLALGRPLEAALACFEAALERAPYSQPALEALAAAYSTAEDYPRAAEIYQRLLHLSPSAGSLWGSLGHCALMMDDLQRAYAAYQQALYHLPDPKEPKLWYGIGILYDRYGSLEHAEEAFSSVLRMDPAFEKSNEIYFRLGIIYKTQGSLDKALECFSYILHTPPTPLSRWDILFQIGHVYESQRDFEKAKETFEKVLEECPIHGKVLQQLGWLYQDSRASFHSLDSAAALLSKSIEVDSKDAQTWYLLGRVAMAQQKYTDAYESYQQAV